MIIIAGANGSGKTRLKQAIVNTIKSSPVMNMTLLATRKEEKEKYFTNGNIEIKNGTANPEMTNYIQSRHYGAGQYVGSVVQIDSERNILTVKYNQVNWLGADPDDQKGPGNFYFSPFSNRWQDFMNYIHQNSAIRDKKIAEAVKKKIGDTDEKILKNNPDPWDKYKEIFKKLLPDKELQDINPASPKEFQYKDVTGSILPFGSLSSGEQEVVKILFDTARKDIKHSIVIVDEPELHLHPTLSFKLIETLKTIGDNTNQFIFLTHSADLISTYYATGDVYFVDSVQTGTNQAHKLSNLDHTHRELKKLIGDNLGLFAVGKKLIFVEGETASIDRLAYHSIARTVLPDAKIIPIGSVENVMSLNALEQEINNSIFGIDFYMVRDRDGFDSSQIQKIEKNGRIRFLKKRHIENYFLDSGVLFKVAKNLYSTVANTKLTQTFIETEIKRIAEETINFNLIQNTKEYIGTHYSLKIPTVKSHTSKDINQIKKEIVSEISSSLDELTNDLQGTKLELWISSEEKRLKDAFQTEEWKNIYQGKVILSRICGEVLKEDIVKVKQAYIDIALAEDPGVFSDVVDIMKSFQ